MRAVNKTKKTVISIALSVLMLVALIVPVLPTKAAEAVVRNTMFTSVADMQAKLGVADGSWSPAYLTDVENYYWTFNDQGQLGSTAISINIAKNAYRNLEMLLDNGYTMDYNELAAYCKEYYGKINGVPDAFYNVLTSCLQNPYLLNRPAAVVTATTYNGRDYSKVFDATYYYNNNPDVQASIGNNPAELLRHFVEVGVAQGRRGNASFDINAYVQQVDAQSMKNMKASAIYKSLGAGKPAPVGKYSYSFANYYGKYLGHYTAGDATAAAAGAQSTTKVTAATYTETSTTSVYTGLPTTAAQANVRPIAVMMPTDKSAQPSYGIGNADILYEIMEEGNISRQMAIIPNWQGLNRIGNIRSCRLYYTYAAKEWDPILIHFGGVAYMKGVIDAPDMNNLSGTYEYGVGGKAPGAGNFFRTKDRVAPHNAYISASGIQKACTQQGYSLNLRQGYYNPKHFTFASGVNDLSAYANAVAANTVDLSQVFSYTKSKLVYNAADGQYYKYIHGKPQVDALTGKQLTFSNVIVQNTPWQQLDTKGYLAFSMLGTTQDGYYITKGKAIHVTWKKTTDYQPTVYYDDNGNEIQLNTGKTYIAVAQLGKNVILK